MRAQGKGRGAAPRALHELEHPDATTNPDQMSEEEGNAAEWCTGRMPLPGKQPIRGGSLFVGDPAAARLTYRREHDPVETAPAGVGFRTVRPFTP